jgi:hypothetical protein
MTREIVSRRLAPGLNGLVPIRFGHNGNGSRLNPHSLPFSSYSSIGSPPRLHIVEICPRHVCFPLIQCPCSNNYNISYVCTFLQVQNKKNLSLHRITCSSRSNFICVNQELISAKSNTFIFHINTELRNHALGGINMHLSSQD